MTGQANVTISAPGFSSASHVVQLLTPGIEIANLDATTTTLSADDFDVYVQVGLPCPGSAPYSAPFSRCGPEDRHSSPRSRSRGVGPPIAQLKSDQPVATGQSVTKPIEAGTSTTRKPPLPGTSYGLAFDPIAAGSTTATVTGPPGFVTMSSSGVQTVTITGPGHRGHRQPSLVVGASLQTAAAAFLDASEHGGVVVTITSSDPSRVRLSPDATTPGATSINVNVPNGLTGVPYYVQGMENITGTATSRSPRRASRPRTTRRRSCRRHRDPQPRRDHVAICPPTTLDWYVQVGLPCAGNTQLCQVQSVRAGGPAFIVSLSNSVETVARLRSDEPAAVGQSVTKPIRPASTSRRPLSPARRADSRSIRSRTASRRSRSPDRPAS